MCNHSYDFLIIVHSWGLVNKSYIVAINIYR